MEPKRQYKHFAKEEVDGFQASPMSLTPLSLRSLKVPRRRRRLNTSLGRRVRPGRRVGRGVGELEPDLEAVVVSHFEMDPV